MVNQIITQIAHSRATQVCDVTASFQQYFNFSLAYFSYLFLLCVERRARSDSYSLFTSDLRTEQVS